MSFGSWSPQLKHSDFRDFFATFSGIQTLTINADMLLYISAKFESIYSRNGEIMTCFGFNLTSQLLHNVQWLTASVVEVYVKVGTFCANILIARLVCLAAEPLRRSGHPDRIWGFDCLVSCIFHDWKIIIWLRALNCFGRLGPFWRNLSKYA